MPYSKSQRSRFRNSTLSAGGGVIGFAWRSVNFSSTSHRKRYFTRLLQSAHTARPSRRLLSTPKPGSRRAGHAVCLGLWRLERLFGFSSSASVASSSILCLTPSDSLTFSDFGFLSFHALRQSQTQNNLHSGVASEFECFSES